MSYRNSIRVLVAAIAATALVAGCGTTNSAVSSGSDSPDAASVRIVHQDGGDVTIPAAPQRIVALDEYAALELIAVGVTPAVVYASLQSPLAERALSEVPGVELVDAPTFLASPNLEDVARRQADVIVMSGTGPLLAMRQRIADVAPTVVVPNRDWRDSLKFAGRAFGAESRATAVETVIDRRFSELSQRASGLGTVLVLFGYQGTIYTPAGNAPLSRELMDAGIRRVDTQSRLQVAAESDNIQPISAEQLSLHRADLTILLDEGHYRAQTVIDAPTFGAAHSVRVDGDAWFGQHPFGVYWVQEDLRAMIGGADPAVVQKDGRTRWAAFTREIA